MANPFQKRASEFQRSETEFLTTLTPELFRNALESSRDPQRLLSQTTVFSAPPGTGKTTLARFFQYTTLRRLQDLARRENEDSYKELHQFAEERGFIRDGQVVVCGARVSMERDYRELSMLSYSPERANDLMISLLSARAVLVWKQMFIDGRVPLENVRIQPTPQGAVRLERMGGTSLDALARRAAEVEAIIYEATARFIPPSEIELLTSLEESFFPLLAIEAFVVEGVDGLSEPITPLLMIDDAHWIDKTQHDELMNHLTSRDVAMGRWVFQRMEALNVDQTLLWEGGVASTATTKRGRDYEDIRLTQALYEQRGPARVRFRRAAEAVSSRYMRHLPDLTRHGVMSLNSLKLKVEPTPQQVEEVSGLPERTARELAIPRLQLDQIRDRVYAFLARKPDLNMEVMAPAMMNILLHRQARHNRTQTQRALFGNDESMAEPAAVEPDMDIAAGAQVHLWHHYRVPFLAGFDAVADLGTENVETFLQLAWQLVRLLETQAVRGEDPERMTVKQQHDVLQKEARHIVDAWSFPHATDVKRLAHRIAAVCVDRSLRPNAPLGGGANAVGIEQSEFKGIVSDRKLADALFYGMAYSAFTLIPDRKAKGKVWTLIELGGPVIAYHGLTTRRGGFVEMKLADVSDMLRKEPT